MNWSIQVESADPDAGGAPFFSENFDHADITALLTSYTELTYGGASGPMSLDATRVPAGSTGKSVRNFAPDGTQEWGGLLYWLDGSEDLKNLYTRFKILFPTGWKLDPVDDCGGTARALKTVLVGIDWSGAPDGLFSWSLAGVTPNTDWHTELLGDQLNHLLTPQPEDVIYDNAWHEVSMHFSLGEWTGSIWTGPKLEMWVADDDGSNRIRIHDLTKQPTAVGTGWEDEAATKFNGISKGTTFNCIAIPMNTNQDIEYLFSDWEMWSPEHSLAGSGVPQWYLDLPSNQKY